MADNALVTLNIDQLPSTQLGSDEAYEELSRGGDFLARLQLFTKGKPIDTGKIRPGHWGIPEGEDEIIDMGDSVDVLPLARRPKALDMSDKSAVIASYDEQSAEFKRIAAKSMETGSGCQHGVSFLVFERSTKRFCELFFGNKSSRPEAKKVYAFLPLTQGDIDRKKAAGHDVTGLVPHGPVPITLKVRLAENKKGSWHVPVVVKCSTPFQQVPPIGTVVREIEKFLEVKSGGVERVQEPEGRKARAR